MNERERRGGWDELVSAFVAMHYQGRRPADDRWITIRERAYGMLDLWCAITGEDAEAVHDAVDDSVQARVEIALSHQ